MAGTQSHAPPGEWLADGYSEPELRSALTILIFFNILAGDFAHGEAAEFIALPPGVTIKAKCERLLRSVLGNFIGAENFLNDGLIVEKVSPNELDLQAALLSLRSQMREVHFFEVLDKNGKRIFKIEPEVGGLIKVSPILNFKSLFQKLWELGLENEPITIRDTHTHPPIPGKSLFSPGDIRSLFVLHAMLELSGFKNFRIESSILYLKFMILNYEKRTIRIESNQLSYMEGDYSLGKLDQLLRKLPPGQVRNFPKMAFDLPF